MLNSTDVFVIGGGPAGLAAAIAARQHGFRVLVADGAKPPIDKACGEALMPDSITALERLGVGVPLADACHLRGVRFLSSGLSAQAVFPAGSCGLSVRRTALHRIMIERAAALGVELLWQTAVTGISREEVQLGERTIRTRWIVGADGTTHACAAGRISMPTRELAFDMRFAGIIAYRHGPTAWKYIGGKIVRVTPRP